VEDGSELEKKKGILDLSVGVGVKARSERERERGHTYCPGCPWVLVNVFSMLAFLVFLNVANVGIRGADTSS
jgi:hypothetical protein